ncbi:MAG: hypothetical protein QOE80_2035, partial [Actinomycetota bacterium]|nr:hypothetical protein [Actinomycetota bacterium]
MSTTVDSLRILLTNVTLATRTGTELYVRDLALRLLQRGHTPVVYSPDPGPVADELRLATVPVVDDLTALAEWTPQLVHGHHTLETILALLRFPGVPAIFVCHDWTIWHDEAPPLDRVVFYVAVDDTCRDRLHLRHGVPTDRLRVIYNWVDLARFPPRDPLPGHPERALLFSNYAREDSHLGPVREACVRLGIPLDVIGAGVGAS